MKMKTFYIKLEHNLDDSPSRRMDAVPVCVSKKNARNVNCNLQECFNSLTNKQSKPKAVTADMSKNLTCFALIYIIIRKDWLLLPLQEFYVR